MFHWTYKRLILLASALLFACIASADPVTLPDNSTTPPLQKAVHGSWRSTAHKARDLYRHPVDTLQFFGIEPGMTVIELEPGDGWYTEILAPFLHARGHLIEASAPTGAANSRLIRHSTGASRKSSVSRRPIR